MEQQTKFQRWYEKNKSNLSAKRAERYAADPDRRAAIQERQRVYRARKRASKPEGAVWKKVGGVRVILWPIAAVAERAGVKARTIRDWEARGIIPSPSFPGRRHYTASQAALICEVAESPRSKRRGMAETVHRNWTSAA